MSTWFTTKAGRETQPKLGWWRRKVGREAVTGLGSAWKASVAGGLGKGGSGLAWLQGESILESYQGDLECQGEGLPNG